MAGPPANISASELWAKLLERPRPSEVVPFPRVGVDRNIRIQVLEADAHDRARIQAREYLSKRKLEIKDADGDVMLRELLSDATAYELLAMACVDENPIPGGDPAQPPRYPIVFINGPDQIRKSLTADEVATLFSAYLLTQQKYGPTERTIESEEELTAWISTLAEGASAIPLARLDSSQRVEWITLLAARSYFLSAILGSLWESLPESYRSTLSTLGLGPSSATKPPSSTSEAGSSPSDPPLQPQHPDAADEAFALLASEDGPLTLDRALGAVRKMLRED